MRAAEPGSQTHTADDGLEPTTERPGATGPLPLPLPIKPPPLGRPEIPDPETPRGGVVMGSIKKNQGGDGFKGAEWVQASAPIMVITKERN